MIDLKELTNFLSIVMIVFFVAEAFQILKSVKQEGIWATRVSFVYSVNENRVYYVENNDFEYVTKYQFCNSY